jgi:Uma2 family endonuclease
MMSAKNSRVLPRRRFDVAEFTRMTAAGVFSARERLELIEGELFEMPTPGPRHSGRVDRLAELLFARCQGRCIVRVQNPLQLDQNNLYLPDLVLVRRARDFYESRYPGPSDVRLAIEVADSSLYRDRTVKLPVYARRGVPRLWIVDLGHHCVHEYGGLEDGGYSIRRRCTGSTELAIPEDDSVTAMHLVD